jgi:membrane protease YdiL (CAAX protease family)
MTDHFRMDLMVRRVPDAKIIKLRHVFGLFGYLLIVWGCYRLIFKLPDEVEEIALKPVLWLIPTFWLVYITERRNLASIGWSFKNLFPSLYWGIGLGMVFAVEGILFNYIKYGQINFLAYPGTVTAFLWSIILSLITAISEETVFRGYILSRLSEALASENVALVLSAVLFSLIHIPMAVFTLHYPLMQLVTYLFLIFIFGLGSGWLFLRTRTVAASIITHSLWGWAVYLFR